MSGFKGKMGIKKVSSHKLVLRKRLYLSEPAEKISCPLTCTCFSYKLGRMWRLAGSRSPRSKRYYWHR